MHFSLHSSSYLVYAGLVFAALSQPYMQHQYGKDWARKAPIRLCDRVLYGVLNETGQEVILLSQVKFYVVNFSLLTCYNSKWFVHDFLT